MPRFARLTLALLTCALVAASLGAASAAAATLSLSVPPNPKTAVNGAGGTPITASGTTDVEVGNNASQVVVYSEDLSAAPSAACAPTRSEEQTRSDQSPRTPSNGPTVGPFIGASAGPGQFSVQINGQFYYPGRYRLCGYLFFQDQTRAVASVDSVTVASGYPACPDNTFTIEGPPVLGPPNKGQPDTSAQLKVKVPGAGVLEVFYEGHGAIPGDGPGLNPTNGTRVTAAGIVDIELREAFSFEDTLAARTRALTKRYVLVFRPHVESQSGICALPDGSDTHDPPSSAPQDVLVTTVVPDGAGGTGGAAALPSGAKPTGAAAKIGAILKAGAYSPTVTIKTAGKLGIVWYLVPKGAKISAAKPVIVASGTKTVKKAGKTKIKIALTAKGRALLKSSKKLKLTAKGTFDPAGTPKPTTATQTFTLAR